MARLPELLRLVRLADDVRGHRRGREELIGPHGRPLVLVSVWLVRLRNAFRFDLEALAPKRGAQTWNVDWRHFGLAFRGGTDDECGGKARRHFSLAPRAVPRLVSW